MSYKTIKTEVSEKYEVKKSVFIGHVKRIENEIEANDFINKIKKEHKVATHNVSAYTIGEDRMKEKYSDDGEPQGTAGLPVLQAMKLNDVKDAVIVVTRYFGGILLGASGLNQAYGKTATLAIKSAGIVERIKGVTIEFTIEYDMLGKVQYLFGTNNWHIENIEYTDKVKLIILAPSNLVETIENKISECTNSKFEIVKSVEEYYFLEGNRLFKTI